MYIFFSLLQNAQASFDWKTYAIGVASTTISMPITYRTADTLTKSSNRLVVGLLPPLLTGILVPSTAASMGTHYGENYLNKTNNDYDWGMWGKTVGLQTIIFTGAAAGKMDISQTSNRLLYTSINALLLPLPTLFLSDASGLKQSKWHFDLSPTNDGPLVSGGYYGTF